MKAFETKKWLENARKDYELTWAAVDQELYELCSRRGHREIREVHAKVAIVNRVYTAGITRSVNAVVDDDPELAVAGLLLEQAEWISSQLGSSADINSVNPDSMTEIVSIHGELTKHLATGLSGLNLCSFVSKYLHFHCPAVPIYDSRVAGSISHVLCEEVPRFTRTDTLLPAPGVHDDNYHWYVARFLRLWEIVTPSAPWMTVKLLDHALWVARD